MTTLHADGQFNNCCKTVKIKINNIPWESEVSSWDTDSHKDKKRQSKH